MKDEAILFIWDRMGDYHLARIRACRKQINGTVYSADLGSADSLYKWDNVEAGNHFVLSQKPVQQKDFFHRFKMYQLILKEKHITHVAMGYGRIEYIIFLLYARLAGIKTIVFCESWYTRGTIKDFFKSLLLKSIGNMYFVSGLRAYEHFVNRYHINPGLVYQGYSVVDNHHFVAKEKTAKNYLLCVARYSEEKNLDFLIRCFVMSRLSEKYQLLIIGDGPLKEKLLNTIISLNTDRVVLSGWKSYAELPEIYAGAIACILPSIFEPWGLVINEAMASGLPILISNDCGCKPDLLDEGVNGWSFNATSKSELIAVLNHLHSLDFHDIQIMGDISQNKISIYTPVSWVEKINSITN
jgi:1,2-diacylglycerol 3-alpha-glucosyltransferase